MVGLIGGSEKPFIDGMAAFSIFDPNVPFCPPAEGCPTPWDYCCKQAAVKSNIALVKLVDENGKVFTHDANTRQQVQDLLQRLNRELEMTMLMVTHDDAVAAIATRKMLMQNGQLTV